MTIHKNPTLARAIATPEAAGQTAVNPSVFDFGNAGYRPAALAVNDKIEVGIVPAGFVLVPQLSLLIIPALDSDGTPVGSASLGTAADPDALAASAVGARTLFGEDFTLNTGPIGSQTEATPIYLHFTVASDAVPTTGKIRADWVIRPWEAVVDGA